MNSTSQASAAASLDDPFYYLANFRFVLAWVEQRHHDLLAVEERRFIERFAALSRASQALLVRMVMRKGELFRLDKLAYAEIGDSATAMAPLKALGWVNDAPELTLDELFDQLRLAELRQALADEIRQTPLKPSSAKALLRETLTARLSHLQQPLARWWPEATTVVVRLEVMALCDRLRLMFFGNLRQDWAEFVLTELGLQRFERVAFNAASRAFQSRAEVDVYLHLHRLRQRLDEGEPPASVYAELPPRADNAWLDARRARLLFQLGQGAERAGEAWLAVTLYAEAGTTEARVRRLRVLEREGHHREALDVAQRALARGPGEHEVQALERLMPRLAKRLGLAHVARAQAPAFERWELTLPGPQPVEAAAAAHVATPHAPVYYVENTLIIGLFGLLCWSAIFAPLPGAFFHPFHHGPADLYRDDFVSRRREAFDACLALLDDPGDGYRQRIRATWSEKWGLASPFVHWAALPETLLDQALVCLPAAHLRLLFTRLLSDLKANRAGLPDLIQLFPQAAPGAPRYRMIEVKGPGDRLQDNQRRWLGFFARHALPVAVCHVRWQREAPSEGEELTP